MEKKKAAVPLVCHGHSRPVVDLFYSPVTPDGYFLISASKDSNPMLRNGETGDWIGTFEGHKGAVWSCCLDTNALRAASGSADFSAKVWDALTGDELHSFEHKHIVRACSFSKDTHLLLTGGMEKILRLYDLNRPDAAPKELAKSPASVRTVAWLHNDQTILSSCTDTGGVRLWDVRSEKIVRTLETKAPVTNAEVSQDGRFITTADGSSVKFWDANNFGLVKSYDMSFTVESASLEPKSGSKFIAGGEDMWVHVFDFITGEELTCNKGHHGPVHCVRFAPGGESYVSGSEDGTIRIWQLSPANVEAEEAANANGKPKVADMVNYTSLFDDFVFPMDYGHGAPEDIIYCQIITKFDLDSKLLEQLVNPSVTDILAIELSDLPSQFEDIVQAMWRISVYLHMLLERFGCGTICVLANSTDYILASMKFLKLCQTKNISMHSSPTAYGVIQWILTLPIFASVFKNILETMGPDDFYKQQKPIPLADLQFLIPMLKQALWEILCSTSMGTGAEASSTGLLGLRELSLEQIKSKAKQPLCELLIELQDWNTRMEFISATSFCCEEVGVEFISKAIQQDTLECEVVAFAPFLIPFKIRAGILQEHLKNSKSNTCTELLIRRKHLVEDSFRINGLTDNQLKGKLQVIFEDKYGAREEGVDLGGPYRQFLEDAIKESFSTKTEMMNENSDNLLYPNPDSGLVAEDHLKRFRLLGTILGLAMFDRAPVDLPLAYFFIRKILQKPVFANDLISLDVKKYDHFHSLKGRGSIPNLAMVFCIEKVHNRKISVEEFLAGGEGMEVDDTNIDLYVQLHANHLLNTQIEQQCIHFLKGFHRLIKKEWMDMFNEQEFQLLVSGPCLEKGLDIIDMCRNTEYVGYMADDPTITMFWEVFDAMKPATQRMFLKFVTGRSRVPFDGFMKLEPKFNIGKDPQGTDRIPTVSTCVNELHLPPYDSKDTLKTKLFQAMMDGGLSFGLA